MKFNRIESAFNATIQQSKTADYTVLHTDDLVEVTCASADITITLPTISGLAASGKGAKAIKIKKLDYTNYRVLIVPASGEKIDDVANRNLWLMAYGDSIILQSDAVSSNWRVGFVSMQLPQMVAMGQSKAFGTLVASTEIHGAFEHYTFGAASGAGMVGRNIIAQVDAGSTGSWLAGLYVKAEEVGTSKRVSGYSCAAEFELVRGAVTSHGGAYGVLTLNHTINSGAEGEYGYFLLRHYGSTEPKVLFNLQDITLGSASSTKLVTTRSASAVSHGIKVAILGVKYWIMLSDAV